MWTATSFPVKPKNDERRQTFKKYQVWDSTEITNMLLLKCPEAPVKEIIGYVEARNWSGKHFSGDTEAEREEARNRIQDVWEHCFPQEIKTTNLLARLQVIPDELFHYALGLMPSMTGFERIPTYDHYFGGEICYFVQTGGSAYPNPMGWSCLGVWSTAKQHESDDIDEILTSWQVCYHGTTGNNFQSIVDVGLQKPGTNINGGGTVTIQTGQTGAGSTHKVYLSPSIDYASSWIHTHYINKEGYKADQEFCMEHGWKKKEKEGYSTFVLQFRVKPGSYEVQSNTFRKTAWADKSVPVDPNFGPHELEWLVEDLEDLRLCGIMLRRSGEEPQEKLLEMYQSLESCKSSRQGTGAWCPDTGNKMHESDYKWQWNADARRSTSQRGPWKDYSPEVNEVIERAYMFGQSKVYIGIINSQHYMVDFNTGRQRRADAYSDTYRARAVRRVSVTLEENRE